MQTMSNTKPNKLLNVRNMVKISVLAAMSALLMVIFKFPLPFAPSFMEVDFAEVPALIGGFAMGPLAGILIEALKIIMNLIINGTKTAGIGELSNFILNATFVGVSAFIYQKNKTKKGAITGLVVGGLMMSALAVLSNAFVIFPFYAKAMKTDLNSFVEMVAKINPLVGNYISLMIFAVLPFNLFKATLQIIVTTLLYKKVSPLLKL